jgi:hypothetical protein
MSFAPTEKRRSLQVLDKGYPRVQQSFPPIQNGLATMPGPYSQYATGVADEFCAGRKDFSVSARVQSKPHLLSTGYGSPRDRGGFGAPVYGDLEPVTPRSSRRHSAHSQHHHHHHHHHRCDICPAEVVSPGGPFHQRSFLEWLTLTGRPGHLTKDKRHKKQALSERDKAHPIFDQHATTYRLMTYK